MVTATLTTGIMFLLFTWMHFGCGVFYNGGPRVSRRPTKWSAVAESLGNTGLDLFNCRYLHCISYSVFQTQTCA
jgi:hypothetical protein